MKKGRWAVALIFVFLSVPFSLFAQQDETVPKETPAPEQTPKENSQPAQPSQLEEKVQLLNNALEEIVRLKGENQNLTSQSQILTQKYSLLLHSAALLREGRQYEAAMEMKKIYDIDPKDADILSTLGILFAELKNYQEAVKLFEQLIALRPKDEKAYSNLAFVYSQTNDSSRAAENYRKAIDLKPDFAVAHYNLGLCYVQLGERENAVVQFKAAANLFDPDSPWKTAALQKINKYSALKGK